MKIYKVLGMALILVSILAVILMACTGASSQETGPIPMASVSGRVYFDENADANCEACECGLEDVRIRLLAGNCGGQILQTTYSDGQGEFQFQALEPGEYCVLSDLPPSCDGFLPTTSVSHLLDLQAGDQIRLEPFGYDLFVEVSD